MQNKISKLLALLLTSILLAACSQSEVANTSETEGTEPAITPQNVQKEIEQATQDIAQSPNKNDAIATAKKDLEATGKNLTKELETTAQSLTNTANDKIEGASGKIEKNISQANSFMNKISQATSGNLGSLIPGDTQTTKAAPTSSESTPAAKEENSSNIAATLASLTNSDAIGGLKEALAVGTKKAIESLSKTDGFLADPKVKIDLPEKVSSIRKALSVIGQEQAVATFVESMNRAAESAVAATPEIFVNSIKQMTIEDAKAILQGKGDEATKYFKKTSLEDLYARIKPIVSKSTSKVGVTEQYKNLIAKLGPFSKIKGAANLDLDDYVTNKALDGLFLKIAEQEKMIRSNPVARTTDILKKVFGAL